MKRGKRQIIEKSNMFGQEEQISNQNKQIVNHFPSQTWSQTEQFQTTLKQQNKNMKIDSKIQQQNHDSYKYHIHNEHQSQISKSFSTDTFVEHKVKESSNADEDRKKRLQMLRQRYLKPSSAQNSKKQDKKLKQQQSKNKNSHYVYQNSQYENKPKRDNQIAIQKEDYQQKQTKNENYYAYQSSIYNQPTNADVNNVEVQKLPTQQQKIKRTVPLPAPARSKPIISEHVTIQQQGIKIKQSNQCSINKIKKQNGLMKPHINQQQKFNDDILQTQQKNIDQLIDAWIKKDPSELNNEGIVLNEKQIKDDLLIGITSNNTQHMKQVIWSFVFNNSNPYSQQQSTTIQHTFCNLNSDSQINKIILLIKCGTQALSRHSNEIDLIKQLPSILTHKAILLEYEKMNLINYLLDNYSLGQQKFCQLFRLVSHNQHLNNLVFNHRFEDIKNVAQILTVLKNNITEQVCPVYFKLINVILPQINNEQLLEQIITHIAKIPFQSAYQLKKDCKLKIIEKIDKAGNKYQNNKQQFGAIKRKQHQLAQTNEQKGFGMSNLMGIVNQTFKKIKSQIPQRSQPQQQSSIEQPKQSITWDPVTKRYLINGKIPQDQMGNIEIAQNDVEKKSKKVPPPPPKIPIKHNKSSPEEINKVEPPQIPSRTQSTETNNYSEEGYEQYAQTSNRSSIPPPPPRAGLKGLGNKKPRLQARYT